MAAADALLTVVVPVYNRERLVRPTLDSIAAQTLRPLRVVLVDNNSTDGTLGVLRQWKREVESPVFAVDILCEPTPGAAAARECGLRAVTTEYTMFFDSDDLMAPVHTALAVDAFMRNPAIDVAGWDIAEGDAAGRLTGRILRFHDSDLQWHNLMHGSFATQRYAARTALFRRAGGWNPGVLGWDDIELAARLIALEPRVVRLPGEPTVIWRGHGDSISGSDFASGAEKWEHALDVMRRRFAYDRFMSRAIGLKGAILAGNYRREGAAADASRLMGRLLSGEPSAFYRILLRLACAMRGRGARGIARLLRPFYL